MSMTPTFRASRKTLHVWGAIAYGHRFPLRRFNLPPQRTVNGTKVAAQTIIGEVYAEQILWEELSGHVAQMTAEGQEVYVVEDNAPVHNCVVANEVRANLGIARANHPPSSPDLNGIEPCWNLLKQRFAQLQKMPTNLNMLWEAAQKAWNEIPIEQTDR